MFNKDGTDFNDKITTDFLKELAQKDRNLFERFVDYVKNLLKRMFTMNGEKRDINRLEQKFLRLVEDARKQRTKGEQGETEQGQYSLVENKNKFADYDKPITAKDIEVLRSISNEYDNERVSINKFTSDDIKSVVENSAFLDTEIAFKDNSKNQNMYQGFFHKFHTLAKIQEEYY